MMLVNPETLWIIIQARQDELLEDIRMRQLWRQMATPNHNKPKLWQKLSWQLGDSMVAIGHRLHAQQQLK